MNFLCRLSDHGRRAVVALIITSALAIGAAAQTVPSQQQGRHFGDPGFVGEPINLNVVNADIRDILNYITEQYGVNFVIDKSVKATPVTVNVSEVPWNIALESILSSQELGVQVNGPILRVADKRALAADAEIDAKAREAQVGTQPLYTEFVRLNYARAKNGIARGSESSGTSTDTNALAGNPLAPSIGTGGEMGGQTSGTSGLLPIIQRRLSKRGSIEVDERSNSLIITDVRQNLDAVMKLIKVLDQPEPQVEIEARIVVATRNFSRDIGVQLSGMVFGPRGSGAQGGTLNGAASAQPFPPSLPTQGPNGSLLSSIPNTVIGLTTGVFGTAQISALISAGEKQGQAKIIATPRVTALNNEKAKIESKTQVPISTIQPSQGGGDPIVTTTYVNVPLKLEITPQITDVGTVVLQVLAENASTPPVAPGVAPPINSQVMQTQVTVPDGGTTVVGGVLFDDERQSQDRTPGLSKIPLLGNLFKRKGVDRSTNEILFFITPRISRPDFAVAPGSAGVVTSATIPQPVPLGNPESNSTKPTVEPGVTPAVSTPLQVVQPVAAPQKP